MIELGHFGFDPGFEQPSLRAARSIFELPGAQPIEVVELPGALLGVQPYTHKAGHA